MLDECVQYVDNASVPAVLKTAKCKKCGETISREIDAIEKHMEECSAVSKMRGMDLNPATDGEMRARAAGTSVVAGSWWSTPKHLAGITRQVDMQYIILCCFCERRPHFFHFHKSA